MRWAVLLLACLPAFAADRTVELPCTPSEFAPSGDGSTVWFLCESRTAFTAYALDTRSNRVVKLAEAQFHIDLFAAPAGDLAILTMPRQHQHDLPVLYQRDRRLAELSFFPGMMQWSADAQRIYFFVGNSANDTPFDDSLGFLQFPERVTVKSKLRAPTESFSTCAANGHIYTGFPSKTAIEYDANLHFVRRWTTVPAGTFSAACRFLATAPNFHGPTPWDIIDVPTGRRLLHFPFTDEELKSSEYEFSAWNPQREGILLRNFYPPEHPVVEVFDVPNRRVVDSLPAADSRAHWSGDGRQVIYNHDRTLIFHSVFGGQ